MELYKKSIILSFDPLVYLYVHSSLLFKIVHLRVIGLGGSTGCSEAVNSKGVKDSVQNKSNTERLASFKSV
jgi:hypothetical protein